MNSPRITHLTPAASCTARRLNQTSIGDWRIKPLLSRVLSSFPAVPSTEILRCLIRSRSINERPQESELPTEADNNALCHGVVENTHVWLIGDGCRHVPLRAIARAQSSPSRQRFGDCFDIERVPDTPRAALITMAMRRVFGGDYPFNVWRETERLDPSARNGGAE